MTDTEMLDFFAAFAMMALMTKKGSPEDIALVAYKQANAMLNEREKHV
jgi:hypothetical protein